VRVATVIQREGPGSSTLLLSCPRKLVMYDEKSDNT